MQVREFMQDDLLEFRMRKCLEKPSRNYDRRMEEAERHRATHVVRNEQFCSTADAVGRA